MSEVVDESKHASYIVIRDDNNNVKLDCPMIRKQFVLRKLADDASTFLNYKMIKVVVTMLGYFNDSQRTVIKDASRIVGLEALRIINGPTAASMVYGFEKKNSETILVFDLGVQCSLLKRILEAMKEKH
ncbi:Stromal 70 kDa heat shock-related protein [Spatholobus suberectus]|nr:Stromal 70 kDa heat shock-related protein [Spatholobus suberectus]